MVNQTLGGGGESVDSRTIYSTCKQGWSTADREKGPHEAGFSSPVK